jgi:hypothetical protein
MCLPLGVAALQVRSIGVVDRRGDLNSEDHLGNRVSFTKRRKRQCSSSPRSRPCIS